MRGLTELHCMKCNAVIGFWSGSGCLPYICCSECAEEDEE